MESIAEHGLRQPIEVQAGSNLLLDGRHRLRACREVECPVEVRKVKIEDAAVPIYTASKAAQPTDSCHWIASYASGVSNSLLVLGILLSFLVVSILGRVF